ncbi:MAG TPA: universal stress protein [Polyangiaceae bacterium]|jgi:nucleotide-binding universal stress UspA family protein|nr:universal stress protein [Polyangiaceae bacterium]
MKSFKKILVPVDFSKHSDEAVQTASDIAKRYGATLTLLHVYEPVAYALPEGYVLYTADQLTQLLAEFEKSLAKAKSDALATGVSAVDARQVDGIAHHEITELARKENYDLIVMGTHGRRGLNRLMMGSVAEKVLRNAPCPVLSVHAN